MIWVGVIEITNGNENRFRGKATDSFPILNGLVGERTKKFPEPSSTRGWEIALADISGGGGISLLEDLLSPSIKAILIKSPPGSGKTTLALELLRIAGKGVYISSRVPYVKLTHHYPWLKDVVKEAYPNAAQSEKVKAGLRFQDLRLASAQDVIGYALHAIKKYKDPLIVIDSWDAIAKKMDGTDKLEAEKTLVAAVDASEARILFVSEEPQLTTTDYLVDAIVNLTDGRLDGKRVREIEVVKARGLLIPQPRHLFSLAEGRFQIIPPVSKLWPDKPARFKPIPHRETVYSTGSEGLDSLLGGGLLAGSYVLLELGNTLPQRWHIPLWTSLVSNSLYNGNGVFFLATGILSPESIYRIASTYVDEGILAKGLRICSLSDVPEHLCFLKASGNIEEVFAQCISTMGELRSATGKGVLAVLPVYGAEMVFGAEAVERVLPLSVEDAKKNASDLRLHITTSSTKANMSMSDICDYHLKMDEMNRSMVFYGVKPPTSLHGLSYDNSEGFPRVRLTPVV